MIQVGTLLNVVDNSGAKKVCCIKVTTGYKRRYAFLGDLILVSVKSLRSKRKSISKIKKGEILKALIVRNKINSFSFCGDSLKFFENAVILLNKKNKNIGSRIFGSLSNSFRFTKYLRIISLSGGLIS